MRIEFTIVDDRGRRYSGAADLGDALNGPTRDVRTTIRQEERSRPKKSGAQALPGHILDLREGGFFREPRTFSEVHEKLRENYSCLPDRVKVALLRLQRRRELRKAIKKVDDQEKTAYVW